MFPGGDSRQISQIKSCDTFDDSYGIIEVYIQPRALLSFAIVEPQRLCAQASARFAELAQTGGLAS